MPCAGCLRIMKCCAMPRKVSATCIQQAVFKQGHCPDTTRLLLQKTYSMPNPCFFRCNSRVLLPPALVFLNTSVTGKSPPGTGTLTRNADEHRTISRHPSRQAPRGHCQDEAPPNRGKGVPSPGHASRCPHLHFLFLGLPDDYFFPESNSFSEKFAKSTFHLPENLECIGDGER